MNYIDVRDIEQAIKELDAKEVGSWTEDDEGCVLDIIRDLLQDRLDTYNYIKDKYYDG